MRSLPLTRNPLALAGLLLWVVGLMCLVSAYPDGHHDFDHFFQPSLSRMAAGEPVYAAGLRYVQAVGADLPADPTGAIQYPPLAVLMVLPFGLLGPDAGRALWFSLSAVAVIVSSLLAARLAPRGNRLLASGAYLLLLAVAEPVRLVLNLGQYDLFVLVLMVAAWLLIFREPLPSDGRASTTYRDLLGGVLIGAAAFIRVYPILVLPFILYRGRWWVGAGLAIAGGVCMAVGLVVLGARMVPDYVELLIAASSSGFASHNFNMGPSGLFGRLFATSPYAVAAVELPRLAISAISAIWIGAILVFGLVVPGGRPSGTTAAKQADVSDLAAFAVGWLGLLIYPYLSTPYLVLILAGVPFGARWMWRQCQAPPATRPGAGPGNAMGVASMWAVLIGLAALGQLFEPGRVRLVACVAGAVAGGIVASRYGCDLPRSGRALMGVTVVCLGLTMSGVVAGSTAWYPLPNQPLQVLAGEVQYFVTIVGGMAVGILLRGSRRRVPQTSPAVAGT